MPARTSIHGLLAALAAVLAMRPVAAPAQNVYPSYGPPVTLSSGDAQRRETESLPLAQAASGHMPPAQPVDSVSINYGRVDGKPVTGYLAFPTHNYKPLPGVLVFPAWWGLDRNVRALTERLAGEGYTVLAVDPFRGRIAPTQAAARELKTAALADPAALDANFRQAYDYLKTHLQVRKVGTVGDAFGGDLSLRAAAVLGARLSGGVVLSADFAHAQAPGIEEPLLILAGGADTIAPASAALDFAASLRTLGKPVEMHVYPGAGHAVATPGSTGYDAAAAGDAWRRSVAFLAVHLKH